MGSSRWLSQDVESSRNVEVARAPEQLSPVRSFNRMLQDDMQGFID